MKLCRAALLPLLLLAACGDDVPGPADASVADAAAASDAGVRALCPMLESPMCTKSEDCGMPSPVSPMSCTSCKPYYNAKTCSFGACRTLENKTPLVVAFVDIDEVRTTRSFVLTVVAGETAGGLQLSCADLIGGGVTIDEPCVTVVDSRTFTLAEANPVGTVYGPYSSNYPTSARSLFVVRGYSEPLGQGDALGAACAEVPAGIAPEQGASRVELDLGKLKR